MFVLSSAAWLLSILFWQWSFVKIILILLHNIWNIVRKKRDTQKESPIGILIIFILTTVILVFTMAIPSEIFSHKINLFPLLLNIILLAPVSIFVWFVIEFLLTTVSFILNFKQKIIRDNLIRHILVSFFQAVVIGGFFLCLIFINKFGSIIVNDKKECIYKNQKYYMDSNVPCCDQFISLYRADGSYFCAPSGGITGGGDGRCPSDLRDEIQCKGIFDIYTHYTF